MQMTDRIRPCSRLKTLLIVAVVAISFPGRVNAENEQQSTRHESLPELEHALENRRFVGPLIIADDKTGKQDILTFSHGKFSSRLCGQFGFNPAPYWVRRDTDGLHFRAVMHSDESGTIRFGGVFDGKQLRATGRWNKERWYWSAEQKFHFTGRPASSKP